MKPILVGCSVVALLVAVALIVVAVRLRRGPIVFMAKEGVLPTITVVRVVTDATGYTLEATLSADIDGFFITGFEVPRSCGHALGLSPPEGFVPEAMPLEPEEREDPDSIEFARKYDAEYLRFGGQLAVPYGAPVRFRLPASNPHRWRVQVGHQL